MRHRLFVLLMTTASIGACAAVTPEFFVDQRVPILGGRLFTSRDDANAELVVILSQEMARRAWPAANPVGQRIKLGGPASTSPWRTVVGISADIKKGSRDPVQPHVYTCAFQTK